MKHHFLFYFLILTLLLGVHVADARIVSPTGNYSGLNIYKISNFTSITSNGKIYQEKIYGVLDSRNISSSNLVNKTTLNNRDLINRSFLNSRDYKNLTTLLTRVDINKTIINNRDLINRTLLNGRNYKNLTTLLTRVDINKTSVNNRNYIPNGTTSKVGINISNPTHSLEVVGDAKFTKLIAPLNSSYIQNTPAACPADAFMTQYLGGSAVCTGITINKTTINNRNLINLTTLGTRVDINKTTINNRDLINRTLFNGRNYKNLTTLETRVDINKTSINNRNYISNGTLSKVGIGTSNPNATMHLIGSVIFQGTLNITKNMTFKDDLGDTHILNAMATHWDELTENTLLDKSNSVLRTNNSILKFRISTMSGKAGAFNFNGTLIPSAAYNIINASINLLNGSNSTPKVNHLSFNRKASGEPVLNTSLTQPEGTHIDVGTFVVGQVKGDTAVIYSYNRNRYELDTFVARFLDRLEHDGTLYVSGFTINATTTTLNITTGTFFTNLFEMTTSNSFGTGREFYFINSSGKFTKTNLLTQLFRYSDGTRAGANDRLNIVWGIVPTNVTGQTAVTRGRLVAVLPSKGSSVYTTDAAAITDQFQTTTYFPPNDDVKAVFTPLARTIVRPSTGLFSAFDTGKYYLPLAGSVSSGGSAAPAPVIVDINKTTVNGRNYISNGTNSKVGIGTIATRATLTLVGNATITSGNLTITTTGQNLNGLKLYTSTKSSGTGGSSIGFYHGDQYVGQIFSSSGAGNSNPTMVFSVSKDTGTPAEAMRLTEDGYLGIATTTPKSKLDVIGNFSVNGTGLYVANGRVGIGTTSPLGKLTVKLIDGTGNGGIVLESTADNSGWDFAGETGTLQNLYIQSRSSTGVPTTRAFIKSSNGNFGIGTTAPNANLQVANNITARHLTVYLNITISRFIGRGKINLCVNNTGTLYINDSCG